MKDDSLGIEHVILSGERIIPLGHRHTDDVPLPPEAPDPGRGAGANRQRWEQCSWSQGLERTCWESSCITWKKSGSFRFKIIELISETILIFKPLKSC